MIQDTKKHYSRFLDGHSGKYHFAAHSHHFWPDVSRNAHLQYWDDSALESDKKWNKIFTEIIPKAQKHIANILHLKYSEQIVLAPNTHELTSRLLSLFLGRKTLNILTTSSEFHSWKRQILRLSELPEVQVTSIPTTGLLNERARFIQELKNALKQKPDLFFISQVFFDSGLALTDSELKELFAAKSPSTIMVVDGYHAFGALPTNLSELEGKIFYLGGGYKYAQAGEGCAFMVVPQGDWRPAYTGWFAEYADLSATAGSKVGYAKNAMAFMGATQDVSGLYRFNAVWEHFQHELWSVERIHEYVLTLQASFLQKLPPEFCQKFQLKKYFLDDLFWHGHFLTFEAPDSESAQALENALLQENVIIDRRGNRLRFGLGLYQDQSDIQYLTNCLRKMAL